MARFGLSAIGAEEPVPPRQVEAEVAVRLPLLRRLVNPGHVRRDHDPAQTTVDPLRQAHIRVAEHGGRVQQHLEDEHRKGGAPIIATAPNLISIESTISTGWKRTPVVTSNSRSARCIRCSRQSTATAWKATCWA